MVDFTKQGREESPRMMVLIQSVDVATRTASGIETKNNSPVTGIDLSASHARMIDWPRVGEHWALTKVSESWFLDYKLAYGNDAFQKDAAPGDSVLVTDGTVYIQGSAVRLVDLVDTDIIGSLRSARDDLNDQTAGLRSSVYGGSKRTRYPACEVNIASDFLLPTSNQIVPAANWQAPQLDTEGGWGGGFYTIPIAGRWIMHWWACMMAASAGIGVSWITLNGGWGAPGMAQQNQYSPANYGTTVLSVLDTTFSIGDKLYFGVSGDQANTYLRTTVGAQRSRVSIRYVGPT